MDLTPLYTALQGFANAVTAKKRRLPVAYRKTSYAARLRLSWILLARHWAGTLSAQVRRPYPQHWQVPTRVLEIPVCDPRSHRLLQLYTPVL